MFYSPFPSPQEALPTGPGQGSLPRQQSQTSPSPQDKSLASETKVSVPTATLSFFPPQTLPNETQVITATLALAHVGGRHRRQSANPSDHACPAGRWKETDMGGSDSTGARPPAIGTGGDGRAATKTSSRAASLRA